MDEVQSASELVKSVNVFDAIMWLNSAWDVLHPDTIKKCFDNCGFNFDESQSDGDIETPGMGSPDEDTLGLLGNTTWEDFITCDDGVATTKLLGEDWEAEVIAKAKGIEDETVIDEDGSDDEEASEQQPDPVINAKCAIEQLDSLTKFAFYHDDAKLLKLMSEAKHHIEARRWASVQCSKQSNIMDYFKK